MICASRILSSRRTKESDRSAAASASIRPLQFIFVWSSSSPRARPSVYPAAAAAAFDQFLINSADEIPSRLIAAGAFGRSGVSRAQLRITCGSSLSFVCFSTSPLQVARRYSSEKIDLSFRAPNTSCDVDYSTEEILSQRYRH